MSKLVISLKDIRNTIEVEIGEHTYHARRLGAGEELDAASQMRRLFEIVDELQALEGNKLINKQRSKLTAAEAKKVDKLLERTRLMNEEIDKLQRQQLAMYISMLDDGVGGRRSRPLINGLTFTERDELFKRIFAEADTEDKPEKPVEE